MVDSHDDLDGGGTSKKPAAPPEERKHPTFPIILGAALAFALLLACTTEPQPVAASSTSTAAPEAPAAAAASATAAAPAPAPVPDPASDPKTIKSELDGLATHIKELQSRIDSLPKPAPPPDLEPLRTKIDDLSKTITATATLPKTVSVLDARLGSLDKSLTGLRGEIVALRDEVKKTGAGQPSPAAEKPATEGTKPTPALATDAALSESVGLYKAGKFKEATDAFRKLTETYPDDARVWYYAALSNGLATNQWQEGETLRLVTKGAEREKAGSPEIAKINAAFSDLAPASKTWLDYYRKTPPS